jgi:hypothetical protein
MELLEPLPDKGYPAEFLVSRIRGKRSGLISDWNPLVREADPLNYLASERYRGFVADRSLEGLWSSLLREYRWVYSRMNEELRLMFSSFFLYAELRTLFIGLRHLKNKKLGKAAGLFDQSLLSPRVKAVLSMDADTASAVNGLENIFVSLSAGFKGMNALFERDGLRGVERFITDTYLTMLMENRLHALMTAFFSRLIDARNILALHACLRHERKCHASFIPGGTVPAARLQAISAAEGMPGLYFLIRKCSGSKAETKDPAKVEAAFTQGITRFLKRAGRDPLGAGPILDYLWRCSVEVMNLSLLISTRQLDRETVTAELVR